MEHIKIIIIVLLLLKIYLAWLLFKILFKDRKIIKKKIIHRLEYVEPNVTVALRHRFSSIEEFRDWRNWRGEISKKLKSFNK